MKKKVFFIIALIATISIVAGLYLYFFYFNDEGRKVYTSKDFPEALDYMTEEMLKDSLDDLNKQYRKLEEGDEHVYIRWINIGILKKRLHDYPGTEEAWQYAATYNPDQYLAYGNLADFYLYDLGEYKKAEEYYLKALEMRPDLFTYYLGLCELYRYNLTDNRYQIEEIMLSGAEYNPMEAATYYLYLANYFYYDNGGRDFSKSRYYRQKTLELDSGLSSELPNYEE